MKDLKSMAGVLFPTGVPAEPGSPLALIFTHYGHYRLDHFDQPVLEDLRQRLSRRGISLIDFRKQCLPTIQGLLKAGLEHGVLKEMPPLFSYEMPAVYLGEYADGWLKKFQQSAAPETVHRYKKILERDLLSRFEHTDLCALDAAAVAELKHDYLAQGGGKTGFQFYPRILYFVLDFAVAQAIAHDPIQQALDRAAERPLLLKEVAAQWLETLDADIWEDAQRELVDVMLPLIGLSDLRKMGERRLYDYRHLLAQHGKGSQVFKTHVELLNQIRAYAIAQGLIPPTKKLNIPKTGRAIKDHLPGPEVQRAILRYDAEEPDLMILRLAWQMGLRNEEIRLLRWSDIDLDKGIATVSGRRIPIPEDLSEALKALAVENGGNGFVVLTAQKKISPVSMAYLIRAAQETFCRYGIEHVRLDDLRNDYVIGRLKSLPPEKVVSLCGFKDIAELQSRYADFLPDQT